MTTMVRIPGKRSRRPGNPDEPVCIALSSDEEGGEEDENSRTSNHDGNAADQQSRRVGVEEQGRIWLQCVNVRRYHLTREYPTCLFSVMC